MPKWVENEDIWNKARETYEEQTGRKKDTFVNKDWATVTVIYKNMGGKVKEKVSNATIINGEVILSQVLPTNILDELYSHIFNHKITFNEIINIIKKDLTVYTPTNYKWEAIQQGRDSKLISIDPNLFGREIKKEVIRLAKEYSVEIEITGEGREVEIKFPFSHTTEFDDIDIHIDKEDNKVVMWYQRPRTKTPAAYRNDSVSDFSLFLSKLLAEIKKER